MYPTLIEVCYLFADPTRTLPRKLDRAEVLTGQLRESMSPGEILDRCNAVLGQLSRRGGLDHAGQAQLVAEVTGLFEAAA